MRENFDDIVKSLKPGVSDVDVKIFNEYCKKNIRLIDCLELFKKNNEITDDIDINHFCRWLLSLGYWK